jgi:curved DNA-binding protein CbpA
MSKRDPHAVLGVEPGDSMATIKAAWRRLARTHHPDLTGDDPAASRVATRRMAEINDAYEALRRDGIARDAGARQGDGRRAHGAGPGAGAPGTTDSDRRAGGPPRPRPSRPVTGRVDTSNTFRPRNAAFTGASSLRGHAPFRSQEAAREPPRASQPTGPAERGRIHRFRAPAPPSLDAASGVELEFGKFRGHTLGEVAAFEPSYVDWLAKTITRDRDLVAAARVIQDDLDRRGVVRRERPGAAPAGRSA